MAGTVRVRTRNVSSRSPQPMMRPTWIMIAMEPNISPNMLAAKMIPAEVMTEAMIDVVFGARVALNTAPPGPWFAIQTVQNP